MDVSDSPMSPETPPSAHGRWLPGGVLPLWVPVTSTPIILGMDHKPVERIYQNLEHTRAQHVCQKQKNIQFGASEAWADVEADEVDLGKEVYAEGKKAKWEQWGGIVQRGQPHTLFLFRLKPKATTARAPGPGPIRKWDWKPLAWKLLKDRSIILHTDGAKAYKLAVPGVLHDNVVHKKKRIMVAGKATWVKPRYTKKWTHTLPGGKKLHVRAGTQIIDRFWGHLRTYLKHAPRKVGSATLMRKIRAAQWTYWYSKKNAWTSTATMLRAAILSKVRIVPKEVRALHVSLFVCICQSCTRPSVSSTAFICQHLPVCFNCNLVFKTNFSTLHTSNSG